MTEKEKSSFQIKDSEDLFKIICACVAGVFVFFIKELLDFREYLRENNIWTLPWSCTLISLATIVVLYNFRKFIKRTCNDLVMRNLSDKYVGIAREIRTKKILKWIYDTFYYSSTTIFSLWTFNGLGFMPIYLGGNGSCGAILDNHPHIPETPEKNLMIAYNMIQFGNHLFALIELVFFRKDEELKYYEYTLHHFMASGLIFYSCFFNFMHVSTLVLVLHDISDIILAAGRSYLDLQNKNKYLITFIMIFAVLVWISTRNFIFPVCIIHSIYIRFPLPDPLIWDKVKHCFYYMFIQLLILFLMHCYWTFFVFKISFEYLRKTNVENFYDNKEFSKLKKKEVAKEQEEQVETPKNQ